MTGGTYKAGYFDYEWSVGELSMIETFTTAGNIYTQGVLQPFTEYSTRWPQTVLFLNNEIKIFPNATTGYFEVNFLFRIPGKITMQLLDEVSSTLLTRSIKYDGNGSIEKFNIGGLPSAIYKLLIVHTPDDPNANGNFSVRRGVFNILKGK
jgi:hypothetical protein